MIRKSFSLLFSVILVKKKYERIKSQLCVNIRKHNAIFDLCLGFWHESMHSKDAYKTLLMTCYLHCNLYWLNKPFDFRNVPAIF